MFKVCQLSSFALWCSRLSALFFVFVLALLMAIIPAAPVRAQEAISWDDLQAHSTHLRNPYEHLSEAQTYRLSSLYQLKEWTKENPSAPESIEAKEIQRLEQTLAAEGLDTDALLVHADEARAYWRSQSQITNPDLEEQSVQLSGYILPLGNAQADSRTQTVSEFLLVPYVGACIHVPTPPPNQMVYIKPRVAIENPGLFSAVQITGKLRSRSGRYELFRVDGSRTIEVSYAMDLEAITPAPDTNSLAFARQITGPWWRTLPARVSNVLTVSLGNLSRQTSPRTLIMAMLLSFSYGVLHTLGPGHGKAVIVSYFVGNGGSMRRGIVMGIRIALFHVLSAVVIVVFTDQLVQQVGGSSASSYRVVQLISYGAIALIGGWMLRQALKKRNTVHSASYAASGDNATVEAMLYPSLTQQLALSETGQLDRLRETVPQKTAPPGNSAVLADCSCLTCEDPQGIGGWLALAVGAVPCSGALLVLLYGLANDLLWPSVAMVISISVGMAFTLAWIGALAILGNRYGHQAAARQQQKRLSWKEAVPSKPNLLSRFSLVQLGQVAGASCVLLLGASLFLLTLTE
ncbi:transporter, NiCoT family, putative [Synechococcus sp. PCC 7335]|uniref:HoxN/HupN/NixA family nickel/cobalt transporter n=1 Tax=Synechococcus sp. (strain ATCC 29403 / PCC 7335) TaxID=91464 RepID=UPI00017EC7C2|nr:DUF3299 domain-containing protein [Synechococcus sp. PCC 7335]EDX86994.1 transporter, NiCoT family, putative [Synechococcus sp. PCC 7335]